VERVERVGRAEGMVGLSSTVWSDRMTTSSGSSLRLRLELRVRLSNDVVFSVPSFEGAFGMATPSNTLRLGAGLAAGEVAGEH
jgi:hypothetical protein